jgi:hypothetical protein
MWGAGIPTIYYGFPCDHDLRLTYWGMVRCYLPYLSRLELTRVQTSITALCCTFLTLSPRFGSPQFRHWRAMFYAGFGFSSIFFVIHGLVLYGWEVQRDRMSLVWMGWMATANLLGAAIYAARVSVIQFRDGNCRLTVFRFPNDGHLSRSISGVLAIRYFTLPSWLLRGSIFMVYSTHFAFLKRMQVTCANFQRLVHLR